MVEYRGFDQIEAKLDEQINPNVTYLLPAKEQGLCVFFLLCAVGSVHEYILACVARKNTGFCNHSNLNGYAKGATCLSLTLWAILTLYENSGDPNCSMKEFKVELPEYLLKISERKGIKFPETITKNDPSLHF
ncbi:hypothetical protein CEXT_796721 [Caerostris extrusa]|uniref:Uncharacterized protein n=1 Tax=Caerostris extrusa TaxID=172846 RepID=A0AAV4QJ47_CAEEX|nr:hypothetical protein CEXT_796721 [Caerostris extrusa]